MLYSISIHSLADVFPDQMPCVDRDEAALNSFYPLVLEFSGRHMERCQYRIRSEDVVERIRQL